MRMLKFLSWILRSENRMIEVFAAAGLLMIALRQMEAGLGMMAVAVVMYAIKLYRQFKAEEKAGDKKELRRFGFNVDRETGE